MNKQRLVRIDMMTGLAMIFVVLGHFSIGYEPQWYSCGLHNWIYSFHMELFLFLSAFLIRYTYRTIKSPLEYAKYIWRKFKKFFVWFLLVGMTIALIACQVKHLPLTASYAWQSLRTLLLYPRCSEASFLWYIYILFGFYIISPLIIALPQLVKTLLCVAAMFLPMVDAGFMFDAYDFCHLTFFYFLGILCAEWIDDIRAAKPWLWLLLSAPFLVYTIWIFSEGMQAGFQYPSLGWWQIVTGTASLPLIYLLAMAFEKLKPARIILTSISKNCFCIYLLQMFIIWGCARLVHTGLHDGIVPFWLFMSATSILAIAIPIILAHLYRTLSSSIANKKSPQPTKKQ